MRPDSQPRKHEEQERNPIAIYHENTKARRRTFFISTGKELRINISLAGRRPTGGDPDMKC
ncbi:hypothetical protein KAU33_02670, partial [Candidatus Dependentiae bacterium]|nr:hypothetical protein [Candidatus Dependentiae bacterium]